jgi:hypothetical protein
MLNGVNNTPEGKAIVSVANQLLMLCFVVVTYKNKWLKNGLSLSFQKDFFFILDERTPLNNER